MEAIKYLIIAITLWSSIYGRAAVVRSEEYCPKICDCYSFQGYNRADCRERRLISAHLDISVNVQILDLNRNDIRIIDDQCFRQQIHITNLSLAHNSIHTIYVKAFATLGKLRAIDLSYNRLEYINENLFASNLNLLTVDLSGNKFMSFPNRPLFISSTVANLYLRNSQISFLYPKMFSQLLSLQELDIAENLMISLSIEPFNLLSKLQSIDLQQNRWTCDKQIETLVRTFKSRNVKVKMDMCQFELNKATGSSNMFERIVVDPTIRLNGQPDSEAERTVIESVWKTLDGSRENDLETCLSNNVLYACNLYKQCVRNLTSLTHWCESELEHLRKPKSEKTLFHLIDETKLSFIIGLCIGAAIVFVMVACSLCATKCCRSDGKQMRDKFNLTESANQEFQYLQMQRLNPAIGSDVESNPPPIPVRLPNRRRRRRQPPPPPPNLNRSVSVPCGHRNQSGGSVRDFANYISRFLERPSRNRYYRVINENTAHLVRRLSRTSLVNNRLSQHFLNETLRNRAERSSGNRSPEINRTEETSEVPPAVVPRPAATEPERSVSPANENECLIRPVPSSAEASCSSAQATAARPETPPPPYLDVVKF